MAAAEGGQEYPGQSQSNTASEAVAAAAAHPLSRQRMSASFHGPQSSQSLSATGIPHCYEFRDPSCCERAFEVLNELRMESQLCDVVLTVGNQSVSAHRVVLAACSPYFRAMFTGELAESRQSHVTLHEISPLALELLVDFAYSSQIDVTESNVQVLLPAANLLQLVAVRDACSGFLQSQLDSTNCLGIKAFADLHACPDLKMAAHLFAQHHFVDVVKSEEFMCLSAQEVTELISSDDLGVRTEEHVYEAVLAWVKHDEQMREKDLPKLMECVRLPLLSKDYLVSNVESEPIMRTNSTCKDYIIEAMKFHLMGAEQRGHLQTPRTRLRKSIGLPKMILVIGGQAPKAIRSVERFDFGVQKWSTAAELNSRRCRCGVAVHNGLVYAVGGFDGSSRVRYVKWLFVFVSLNREPIKIMISNIQYH